MASHEAYLRSALSKYRYPDQAKRDILNAFQSYTDLKPKLDTFVFNDGIRKELLCLDGTIPVNYKGKTYNIPVCLWMMDTHPYNPPMVYVKPTSGMQIKQGRHVDASGRIYLPYLHEWKHPQSDLFGLIQILTIVFGEEPPVFSKTNASTVQQTSYPNPGALPYPSANVSMPMPNFSNPNPTSYSGANMPQYPPAPYPSQYPGYGPPNQPPQPVSSFTGYNPTSYPPAPRPTHAPLQQTASVLSDEQIKASLLSAVEDKMKRRLKEIFAQAEAERDALRRTQEDLQRGKQTLESMLEKLEKEQSDVERNISVLQEKDREIQQILEKMKKQDDLDIDKSIEPTTPLYKQLLNTFAEEQATEDAIYYLGEALRKGVIELDVFLKQVRELSRRQFMLRMLIYKCRETAKLPNIND